MNKEEIFHKETPLSAEDCFLVMRRPQTGLNFPLHVHLEFELNYLENASGAIRIVGDSLEVIDDIDLVLIAGGTKHAYSNHKCLCKHILEVTIQFRESLFESLLEKRHFKSIKDMFSNAINGLVFSKEMVESVNERLKALSNDDQADSFKNLLALIDILKILSLDKSARKLNATSAVASSASESDRLEHILLYLHENYRRRVTLSDVAECFHMSEASLTRFLRKWTGKTFVDHLNEVRIAEAIYRLTDTSDAISEICYKCGFHNISNFNRVFKRRKGCTPSEYREMYSRSKQII